jgi:hypothetical protein
MDRRALLLAMAAAALAAPAFAQDVPEPAPAELEPVHKVIADRHGLTIRVTTHGCTTKADFAHFTEPKGQAITIAFARRRLDRCRSGESQLDILFSYEELGLTPGQPVMVLNPLAR